jgi:hypothetical protein
MLRGREWLTTCKGAGGGKIRVDALRTDGSPSARVDLEGGPAAVLLSSANTSLLFENMLPTTANPMQVLCSPAGG